jgi:hypothetical protein
VICSFSPSKPNKSRCPDHPGLVGVSAPRIGAKQAPDTRRRHLQTPKVKKRPFSGLFKNREKTRPPIVAPLWPSFQDQKRTGNRALYIRSIGGGGRTVSKTRKRRCIPGPAAARCRKIVKNLHSTLTQKYLHGSKGVPFQPLKGVPFQPPALGRIRVFGSFVLELRRRNSRERASSPNDLGANLRTTTREIFWTTTEGIFDSRMRDGRHCD